VRRCFARSFEQVIEASIAPANIRLLRAVIAGGRETPEGESCTARERLGERERWRAIHRRAAAEPSGVISRDGPNAAIAVTTGSGASWAHRGRAHFFFFCFFFFFFYSRRRAFGKTAS